MSRLLTETNTRAVSRLVLAAARSILGKRRHLSADFEHGQWWITDLDTGRQWSVCDDTSAHGVCFEQVSAGDEP